MIGDWKQTNKHLKMKNISLSTVIMHLQNTMLETIQSGHLTNQPKKMTDIFKSLQQNERVLRDSTAGKLQINVSSITWFLAVTCN